MPVLESSSINEVIRPVFFFYDKISQVQKKTLKDIKKHFYHRNFFRK